MSYDPPSDPPAASVTLDELLSSSQSFSGDLSPEALERLRRSVDLRIDAEGGWWHEGERFTHPRLIAYFNRQLGWRDGEATLTVGARWCYVRCDVTPFLALKLERGSPSGPLVLLNTGERLPLAELQLRGDVLFAQLSPARLARWSRHAQAQCGAWLREARADESEASSGFVLELDGRSWPIQLDPSDS